MRWSRFVVFVAIACLIGCRGLPHAPLSPLPNGHETPVGQFVFHSDFELPHDHRLVRELVEEREYVSNTLGLGDDDTSRLMCICFAIRSSTANTCCGTFRPCHRGGHFF